MLGRLSLRYLIFVWSGAAARGDSQPCQESSALFQFRSSWPGDELEICQVNTGLQVRPISTCSDFAHGSLDLSQESDGDADWAHAKSSKSSKSSKCKAHLKIQAFRGETESAQILLRIPSTLTWSRTGTTVTSNSFLGIPHGVECKALQVGFVFTNASGRVPDSGGGWRPDPLRPLVSAGVPSNVAQPLWVQCFVSELADAGHHEAELLLTLQPGGSVCVDLSLEIWNVSIPSLEQSKVGSAWRGMWRSAEFEPYYGPGYWEKNKQTWFDLMLDHRTPPDMVQKHPRPIDDFVYISGKGTKWLGILNVGSYKSGHANGCPQYTDNDIESILQNIKPTLEALKEKKLENRSYVYGFDEVPAHCEPELRQVFGAVKEAFPGLKTMAAINWEDLPTDLPLDIWVLQYQLFDQFGPEASRTWTEAGKDLWLYHCIEPGGPQYLNTFAERPSIQGRLLFWLAALWEIQYGRPTGWLYYEMNVWKPCNGPACGGAVHKHPIAWLSEGDFRGTAFTDWPEANFIWQGQYDTIFANGDGQFVYPCPDGPCGSVRLDAIRDGLEDWELFRAVGSEAVPLIKRVVQSPTKWNADPQLVFSIRGEAAKILMARNAHLR
eukprot:s3136_g13.t1